MSAPFSAASQEIRAVLDQIAADWTAYPLVIEGNNRNVIDLAKQKHPFVCADIRHIGGKQFDLGAAPRSKQICQLHLAIADKDGQGTGRIEALLDFLVPYFNAKDLATVRFHTASLAQHRKEKEWYYQPIIMSFWYIWE